MKTETKQSQLMEFAKDLKQAGFKVYKPAKLSTYLHFVKDGQIGYVEAGDHGFNFTTVHKPCHECGTGFSMYRDAVPTVQMAIESSTTRTPSWATRQDSEAVKKYRNWEEFTRLNTWQTWEEI